MKRTPRALRPRIGVIVFAAGISLLAAATAAFAAPPILQPTNGTLACRATNSTGASSFYYNNTYLWNNGATNQFLTCVLPDWNTGNAGNDVYIAMNWAAGATGGSLTCTAQIGAFYNGVNNIVQGSTKIVSIAANGNTQVVFPNPMTHTTNAQTVNIICNVPAGFKLGLIEHWRTQPAWLDSFCGNFGNPNGCADLSVPGGP